MTVLFKPIHIEAVGLANVRFFASPTGAREFPWSSLDDIFDAMALDRSLREAFRRSLPGSEWIAATRTVATSTDITLIVQHFIAQGSIDAMTQVGRCPADLYWQYAKAGAAALGKLTDGFGKDDVLAYLRDAFKAGGGAG